MSLLVYWADSRNLLDRVELQQLHGCQVISVTREEVLIATPRDGKVVVISMPPTVTNGATGPAGVP